MIGNQLSLPALVCLTAFIALLVLAALEDVQRRRIPNWLTTALVVLYPAYVLASPAPVPWAYALATGGAVFLVGLVLFARGILGGGDAKLITAVSLWAGIDHLAAFTAVTSLAGGVLAFWVLAWQRYGWKYAPLLASCGAARVFSPESGSARLPDGAAGEVAKPPRKEPVTLPYGVAIAAGGLVVALRLMTQA